jgi:hypothetical protein
MTREEEIKFRDECAMRAMPAIMYSELTPNEYLNERVNLAKMAFDIADAMLEEKKKRNEKLS